MLIGMLLVGSVLTAHAGISYHGISYQGISYQGISYQGPALVSGPAFSGAILAGGADESGEPVLVTVDSFRGDVAEGMLWDAGAGVWREAVFHPGELVGAHWSQEVCDSESCVAVTFRIASAVKDQSQNTMPEFSDNSDIWLYQVEYTTSLDPAAGDWTNACGEGDGEPARGLFVDGQWSGDGAWSAGGYTFSCPAGVVAKCARSWGYKPWKSLPATNGQDIALQPLHQACTRAARADYCGDGDSHTQEGTVVDMFDAYRFNVRTRGTGFLPEASFDEDGARWMARERWPDGEPGAGGAGDLNSCLGASADRGGEALITVWSNTALLDQ